MSRPISRPRSWSDAQLTEAVKAASSWRGVTRELGLNSMSAGVIRIVRRHAVRLGLDTSHFRGKRRWSDDQLKNAVTNGRSWDEVLLALGLSINSGNARPFIKSHAIRLGLDFSHLGAYVPTEPDRCDFAPELKHLREAGASIAAAWFTLCGCNALFPVEPAVYDLVVSMSDGLRRVQVKTTTSGGDAGWQVAVGRRPNSVGNRALRVPYDPEVIDYFFIVDGDLNMYLIPSRVIAGRVGILLRAYTGYIVGNARGLLEPDAAIVKVPASTSA
jgi:PD-(D/E)XK endonuclease